MKKTEPYQIIYIDENIIAVNKASGIAVCADRWDPSSLRLDKLAANHLGQKVFIVHRIDRDTSGLVIFAKNQETHKKLSLAFESRQIKKHYIAAVQGRPVWKEKTCYLPLVPNGNKKHMTIVDKYRGKKSFTSFRLLGSAGNYSIVEAIPETGRTHQIRVHLASLGHPVICDELYGNTKPVFLSAIKGNWRGDKVEERPLLSRLGLHASKLMIPKEFALTKEDLSLEAPLARDMAALIKQMEKCSKSAFLASLAVISTSG